MWHNDLCIVFLHCVMSFLPLERPRSFSHCDPGCNSCGLRIKAYHCMPLESLSLRRCVWFLKWEPEAVLPPGDADCACASFSMLTIVIINLAAQQNWAAFRCPLSCWVFVLCAWWRCCRRCGRVTGLLLWQWIWHCSSKWHLREGHFTKCIMVSSSVAVCPD